MQLRIRPAPNTDQAAVGSFNSGDVCEVFQEEVNGFYRLVDGRVGGWVGG